MSEDGEPQGEENLPAVGVMADLSDGVRGRLASLGRFEVRPEGDYLTVQGEACHMLVVVISGTLSVTVHAHGNSVHRADLGAGQTIGEMSVIDPMPASATVRVSDGDARLWVIDGKVFDEFTAADPSAGFEIMKALAKQLCFRLRRDSDTMLRQADTMRSRYLDNDY